MYINKGVYIQDFHWAKWQHLAKQSDKSYVTKKCHCYLIDILLSPAFETLPDFNSLMSCQVTWCHVSGHEVRPD